MISVIGKQLIFPNEEQTFVFEDSGTTSRVFVMDRYEADRTDLAGLTFRLDIVYKDETEDTALLIKTVEERKIKLHWDIRKEDFHEDGTIFVAIRGFDADGVLKWTSAKTPIYVEDIIDTPSDWNGDLTELEQMEAAISKVLDSETNREKTEAERAEAETDRADAETERETAEAARKEAEIAREEAEEARKETMADAMEDVAKATEKALNAVGPRGEKGDKGDTGEAFTYDMFTAEQLAGLKGEKGDPGDTGETGNGIASCEQTTKTTVSGGKNVFTVTMTDGTTAEFEVTNGIKGARGASITGPRGYTFTPSVSEEGDLSWTNDGNLENPATVNIKGDKGDKGDAFTYDDFTPEQLEGLIGPQGDKGDAGVGIESVSARTGTFMGQSYRDIVLNLTTGASSSHRIYHGDDGKDCTHEWDGTVLSVTSASGTSSADLKGEKGDPGETGPTGKTAYEYAKDGGYTGTEEDFKEKMAQEIPEELLLYTAQTLTDSQKAQARGNIGAVGTVESTEEVYTYVFTGEEETIRGEGVSYIFLDGVTQDFLRNICDLSCYAEVFGGDVPSFADLIKKQGQDPSNFFPLTETELDGAVLYANSFLNIYFVNEQTDVFLKTGAYLYFEDGMEVSYTSLTSTVPYTKTTQKIDEALIPAHAHSWEELEDKPFGAYKEEVVLISEQEIEFPELYPGSPIGLADLAFDVVISNIESVTVVFDGVTYSNLMPNEDGYWGNASIVGGEDTGEPFMAVIESGGASMFANDTNAHTVSISCVCEKITEIDETFYRVGANKMFGQIVVNPNFSIYNNGSPITVEEFFGVVNNGTGESRVRSGFSLGCLVNGVDLDTDKGEYTSMRVEALTNEGYLEEFAELHYKTIFLDKKNPENNANGELKIVIPELCFKSPSGKLFKLTVDDSGTISATEVV